MIQIHDVTLRDGSHAVGHSFTSSFVEEYCELADECGFYSVEVGHGNGLGASSYQVGVSVHDDNELLLFARGKLKKTKLACLAIPGWATRQMIKEACDAGVDIVRVGCHCTEADATHKHIDFAKTLGKEVHGVLMMAHMADHGRLALEAGKMMGSGADKVILMDSAGSLMEGVQFDGSFAHWQKFGYHAHDNLGCAVGSSLLMARRGVSMLDCSTSGIGAGAGNAPTQKLVAALHKAGLQTGVDIRKVFGLGALCWSNSYGTPVDSNAIASGMAGVFSGFKDKVISAASSHRLDPMDIWEELGKRKVVASQEDMIEDVCKHLKGET